MQRRVLWCAGAVCAAILCASLCASAGGAARAAADPCGSRIQSKPHYAHVIWILEENHSYNKIIGSPSARYINALARECGLATNYHNISHPSLPNYVGMTSGLALSQLRRFASDCNPSTSCRTPAPSIFSQTKSWKAYEDSMPSNCYRANQGEYAVRHNPAPYFSKLRGCAVKDLPYSRLAANLSRGKLPAFSFITPNLIDDMHDGTVAQGNAWLKGHLPVILNSSEYRSGRTAVFVTWDEGEGGKSSNCATNTTDVGCHVATIVISPTTRPGTRSSRLFDHYSLLRTTEALLGLPLLGQAKHVNGMKSVFGL